MITITLPDGSKREFPAPLTVAEVAASIGTGLAKAALGGKVGQGADARLVDTSHLISADESLAIITDKQPEGLELIRSRLNPGGRLVVNGTLVGQCFHGSSHIIFLCGKQVGTVLK